jgi:hypothetical protein
VDTYVVLRRGGWRTPDELEAAAERSRVVGEGMPDEVRWVRSYVVVEPDGGLGTVCVYEAQDADVLREHATRAGLPLDEVLRVAETLIAGPDPAGAATA